MFQSQTLYVMLAASGVFLASIFFRYYTVYRHAYLRNWALSYVFMAIAYISTLVAYAQDGLTTTHQLAMAVKNCATYLQSAILLYGTYQLTTGRNLTRFNLGLIFGTLTIFSTLSSLLADSWLSADFNSLVYPESTRELIVGMAFLIAGIVGLKDRRWRESFGHQILVWCFFIQGMENLIGLWPAIDSPSRSSLQAILAISDTLSQIAMSMGLLIWLLEHERTTTHKVRRQIRFDQAHDRLTSLLRREPLLSKLERKLGNIDQPEEHIVVMHIAMDGFRNINASFGRAEGDMLLRTIADRLQLLCQSGDLCGRIDSDEFILVQTLKGQNQDITRPPLELLDSIRQPIQVNNIDITLDASIGVSIFPEDASRAETLLKHADTATERIKSSGGGGTAFYSREIDRSAQQHYKLRTELVRALQRGELNLYYQPIVSVHDAQVTGAEALIRWHHPELGLLTPDKFLPVARESRLMRQIDQWVLDTAIREMTPLATHMNQPFCLSVNISPESFESDEFFQRIPKQLTSSDSSLQLQFEITEQTALRNLEQSATRIDQLAQMNILTAMDDFGTGQSSLSQLQKFPETTVKIDRSFIADAERTDARIILESMIQMLQRLGRTIVAEGIETPIQRDMVRKLGIQHAQGYFFYRPIPGKLLAKLVKYPTGQQPAIQVGDNPLPSQA